MSKLSSEGLEPIFHPRSIALAGISISNPHHWTRVFLEALIEFAFEGPIYLVNPKGGEVKGLHVYRRLQDIPNTVDYVISTVGAKVAPRLVEECANKGVRAIHFCTAGFGEIDEEEGVRLETQLFEASQERGIRMIGPNCMGIYCPESRLSFNPGFPKQSGPVAFISQSGGNAGSIVRQVGWRGVRFSKVVSYGNASDLNESDFLEYVAADPDTDVVALYIEGVKDGRRFRRVLEQAAEKKVVILLKGGVGEGGTRAAAGHTGALAGSQATWDSLCSQLRIIRVYSLEELADMLVTCLFMPLPEGRNAALIGAGGGNSVLIADEFEKRGLRVPSLPEGIRKRVREFSPAAGNIISNPLDYSQTFVEADKLGEVVSIVSRWQGIDFLAGFLDLSGFARGEMFSSWVDAMLEASQRSSKPIAIVLQVGTVPEDMQELLPLVKKFVASQLPTYLSFRGAATSINSMLTYNENHAGRLKT
ncbi:MAG TPA: hypothetical protein G4O12_08900 [Dehalococcoidia bacterium]|nr:hypothetical protein [Dehalococcoidia bacterium]